MKLEVRQLKVDVQKNELISKLEKEAEEDRVMWDTASREIVTKSAAIRQEYQKALATFGAEPLPSPEEADASGLLDWLLSEFDVLRDVLSMVSDNTAIMTCESVLAILAHEGCPELGKIASCDCFS